MEKEITIILEEKDLKQLKEAADKRGIDLQPFVKLILSEWMYNNMMNEKDR